MLVIFFDNHFCATYIVDKWAWFRLILKVNLYFFIIYAIQKKQANKNSLGWETENKVDSNSNKIIFIKILI